MQDLALVLMKRGLFDRGPAKGTPHALHTAIFHSKADMVLCLLDPGQPAPVGPSLSTGSRDGSFRQLGLSTSVKMGLDEIVQILSEHPQMDHNLLDGMEKTSL